MQKISKMAADVGVVVNAFLNEENRSDEHLVTVIECLEERQSLKDKETNREWVAKVNEYLNSRKNRWLGLCMLGEAAEQCDTDTFTANCSIWMRALLQVFQSPMESTCILQHAIKILEKLLRFTAQFSELSRTIATSVLPSILSVLLSLHDTSCALAGLTICMEHMPGPAGAVKGKIESYILNNLDHWDKHIRQAACECFALLAGYNAGGAADKVRTNWEIQWRKLLATATCTLDLLYENVGEYNAVSDSSARQPEVMTLREVPLEEPARTMMLATRCSTLLQCLTAMIRRGVSKLVVVPAADTIRLLERISSVTEPSLRQSVAVDIVLLRTVLPLVHTAAIELLNSLVLRCGSLLLPYSSRLADLLIRTLSWTLTSSHYGGKGTSGQSSRPYSKLRCAVYECLEHWSQIGAPLPTHAVTKAVNNILDDVRPHTSQTKLIAPASEGKQGKSKRAKKRKLQEDIEQLSTTQKKNNPVSNKAVCHHALSALYTVLINGNSVLQPDVFKDLQAALLGLVLQCQSGASLPPPYPDPGCRRGLYRCLLACLLSRPPRVPSIIHCAVRCFTRGLRDPQYQVSSYCREALTITSALMHPAVPALCETFQLVKLPPSTSLSTESITVQQNQVRDNHTAQVEGNSVVEMECDRPEMSRQTYAVSRDSAASMREAGGYRDGLQSQGVSSGANGMRVEDCADDDTRTPCATEVVTCPDGSSIVGSNGAKGVDNIGASTGAGTEASISTNIGQRREQFDNKTNTSIAKNSTTSERSLSSNLADRSNGAEQGYRKGQHSDQMVASKPLPSHDLPRSECLGDVRIAAQEPVQLEIRNTESEAGHDEAQATRPKRMRSDESSTPYTPVEKVSSSAARKGSDRQLTEDRNANMEETLKAAEDNMDEMMASFVDSSPDTDDFEN